MSFYSPKLFFCVCRFIYISDDLKFNGKSTQTRSIEANSLLMARNGVCFIGDWLALKATSLNYLQNGILLLSFTVSAGVVL